MSTASNGTCSSSTLTNTLSGAGYSGSYAFTHLGQQWQGPINGNGPQQQYLYCNSSHPHQLQGLYPIGTTCATSGSTTANYSVSYDSWGNVISRTYAGTAATLSYDVLNQLVQWSGTNTVTQQSSGQQWSVYDASGQRVLKRSTIQYDTPLTVYAFGSDEHDYSATGQGGNSLYYYSLGGWLVGVLYGSETDALVTDAQGSVLSRLTTTAGSAAVKGNQVYSPYGSKLYSSGSMATNRGYTGQYKDATGLNYDNARYYDSVAGCFISADTVQGNAQGMDPYAYVNGNPETLTDPTGQWATHCHDPNDCGPASNIDYGSVSWGEPGTCDASCQGPLHVRPAPQMTGSGNPKIVVPIPTIKPGATGSTTKPKATGPTTAQGRSDKNLILKKINEDQEGHEVLISTAVGDGLALVADGIAAFIDAAAEDWGGFGFEVLSVFARVAALVGDLGKLGVGSLPSQVNDFLVGLKYVANIVDAIEGFVNFINPVAGIAKEAATLAEQLAKPAVRAGILQIIASVGSAGASTAYQKYRDVTYYDGLRTQINGYNDQQLHDACIHQYYSSDPGECQ